MTTARRTFLQGGLGFALPSLFPVLSEAQTATQATNAPARLPFAPQSGDKRRFEVTTHVTLSHGGKAAQVWLPVPGFESDFQTAGISHFTTTGQGRLTQDMQGNRMLHVVFAAHAAAATIELTSAVTTESRATDWTRKPTAPAVVDADLLHEYIRPTRWIPTDGIVRKTALQATQGARTDVQKARQIYDWTISHTYREPKVRGCGEGDIKSMLETGNLGGKCADINALFVGLCRAAGIPARDLYGIRLAPSRFGYKELSGNSASLKGAQHCRAEVFLKGYGWVAMDPADVVKVMRLETSEWIKDTINPVVAPVNKALFGGWEGNWMAYNTGHDVALPNAKAGILPFFMYPVAEIEGARIDSYAPDDFQYQITAKEIL